MRYRLRWAKADHALTRHKYGTASGSAESCVRNPARWGGGSQPERMSDSSRWSHRSADHRITIENNFTPGKGVRKNGGTPPGCEPMGAPFRWSALRCDHRLLSDSPSG